MSETEKKGRNAEGNEGSKSRRKEARGRLARKEGTQGGKRAVEVPREIEAKRGRAEGL